jgi:protein gp37
MKDFFRHVGYVPENFWLGTSVVDQRSANARIPKLLDLRQIRREVTLFLSCEPLLGSVDLSPYTEAGPTGDYRGLYQQTPSKKDKKKPQGSISFVIVGGESGPNRRPMDLWWARDIRDECAFAGVPFFMKQIDKVDPIPEDLMIREVPQLMRQGRLV